jgi:hypothetical protein
MAKNETKVGKAFWKSLGITPGNVRIAKEEHLKDVLNVVAGCVTPFALGNDKEGKVKKVILDENLKDLEYLAFHPTINTATAELSMKNFNKFMETIER